jgi:hypothetical protein
MNDDNIINNKRSIIIMSNILHICIRNKIFLFLLQNKVFEENNNKSYKGDSKEYRQNDKSIFIIIFKLFFFYFFI